MQDGVTREVRAAILGHSVQQTDDYGQGTTAALQGPLANVARGLLRDVTKTGLAA